MIVRVRAPAKINLVLEVLGRRPDGFHELASVVHAVALYDALELRACDALEVRIEGAAVAPEADLVVRAARLLRARLGVRLGAEIRCRKRIPVSSGLGGGSSDAAATLRALAALWSAPDRAALLAALAAELGSDVPLFLSPGAALIRGRGERVTPLPRLRAAWAVLVPLAATLPEKTARLFAALGPGERGDGARAEAAAAALRAGTLPAEELLVNAFEPAARALHPGLAALQDALGQRAGARFHLSGAGPSLFALCAARDEALALLGRARPLAPTARLARLVGGAAPLRVVAPGTALAS